MKQFVLILIGLVSLSHVALADTPVSCFKATCSLEVDHKSYMKGACSADTGDYGTDFSGKSRYFGRLINQDDGVHGYWNGVDAEDHSQYDLGVVRRQGDCWLNARTKICFSRRVPVRCDPG